jgi:hypothetical protein
MKFHRTHRNIELELRAHRPEARDDFVQTLADEVRSRPAERSRMGRVGLAFALSGLIVVALASFGGIGYASSAAKHAVKKPAAKHVKVVAHSAAIAQYGGYTPKVTPKAKAKATPKPATTAQAAGQTATRPAKNQLPFTGLALWMPLSIGLLLIAFGIALRTRGRRRNSATS